MSYFCVSNISSNYARPSSLLSVLRQAVQGEQVTDGPACWCVTSAVSRRARHVFHFRDSKLRKLFKSLESVHSWLFRLSNISIGSKASRLNIFGSSSAFGIKPATTGSSLFGQPQQQQQQGQSTGLFSGIGQSNQPQQSTSLFGQPQQPTTTTTTGGGLFGQNQQTTAGGGLFGQPSQPTQQPAAGGGLFGQPQQQQPQQATGGLFGQTQTQQPQTGTSLFGQPQQQPQQQTGSLFGNSSLFGNTATQQQQQQPQQQSGGLFGSTNTQTTNQLRPQATVPAGGFGSSFGGSFFGNNAQQPQAQAPSSSVHRSLTAVSCTDYSEGLAVSRQTKAPLYLWVL